MTRLIFGDPESIKIKDEAIKENIFNKLKDKVKCPYCKADISHYYNFDLLEKTISFNFNCKDGCPNSVEYERGEEPKTTFNFSGKCLDK